METIFFNISQVLGITIIHSLWQGLLVYIILRIVFAGWSGLTAEKKYNLAFAALIAVFGCFVYTLISEIKDYNWINVNPGRHLRLAPDLNLPAGILRQPDFYATIARYLPFICAVYLTGLVINIARLSVEWNKLRQIKLSVLPAEQLQQYITAFAKKLNISKTIRINFSELIDVPCVIGYIKPLILLPVSLSANLSISEVEAILLHELSHIKRNDYLLNLLQQAVSVLLFFNPFTQLINRIINQERENVCDDLVVAKTGEPLIYAKALIKLEETRKSNLQLALAATGKKKFQLLNRIERIMKTRKHMGSMRHLIIALFILTGSLSCIAWFNPKTDAKHAKRSTTVNNSRTAYMADSDIYSLASDTGKHKHKLKSKNRLGAKSKSALKADNDNWDNYNDHAYVSDSVKQYFASPQWKAQMENIQKQSEQMRKQFESPAWKAQMNEQRKIWREQAEVMKKQFESKEWKDQMEKQSRVWKEQGEAMKKQFESKEWKDQMLAMQNNSDVWKKQADAMKKQFESKEWKDQMEKNSKIWKEQADAMKKQFESKEWKNQMEKNSKIWKEQADAMKKQFESKEWKNQMEQIKQMSKDLQKQFKNKQWKSTGKGNTWILKDSVENAAPKDTL